MALDGVTTLIKIVEQDLVEPELLSIFYAGGMKVWLQAILEECETIMGIGTLKEMVREIEEVEERILMIKRGTDLDPDEGVWDTYQSALELENEVIVRKDLQSLYWLKVASSDEKPNFGMVPNLMELGIYIEGQLAPSHLGSLVHLHLLEKLKFEVVAIIGRKGSKATPIPPARPSTPPVPYIAQ
nr:putative late blight resistance protein homolog R1B-14 isoform X1 [Ipomoea batatas]